MPGRVGEPARPAYRFSLLLGRAHTHSVVHRLFLLCAACFVWYVWHVMCKPPPKLYRRTPSGEDTSVAATRLKAEGRFAAKKTRQAEYAAGGESDNDAHEMALNDFPPLEESADLDVVASEDADSVIADEVDLSTPDGLRDANWVWSNLGHRGLSRADAPSQAAWSMFEDYNQDQPARMRFREKVLDPLLKQARPSEGFDDDGRLIDLCDLRKAGFLAVEARDLAEVAA